MTFKKLIFGAHFGKVCGEMVPKNFGRQKLRLQLNNFAQKRDFSVFWFRRKQEYKI